MKYKALIEIGGYKPGEEVPEDKAKVWAEMYKESPVEEVDAEDSEEVSQPKESVDEVESEPEAESNPMLDDYLGRNTRTVVDAIKEDKLSKEQLEGLLKLEKSDKKRKAVIKAIDNKLEGL